MGGADCVKPTVKDFPKGPAAILGCAPGAIARERHKAKRLAARVRMQAVDLYGGLGRNRTTDTRIFNLPGLLDLTVT